jgi:amino acid transporter
VIGLAFAVAGYSSFWLLAAMSVLLALVGINYMAICRHYPDGGGVYASVYHRSKIIAIVGAFLLIADYIVTASISALSGFQYVGVPHPEIFAGVAILGIGALNFFGPKRTGELAVAVSVPTVITVVVLAFFSLPHFGEAWHNVKPLSDGFWHNWNGFVGIVLAVSGVEAIANATSVMKLDPGSSEGRPSVRKTSTPAIFSVVLEVSIFTALLGLGMHALGVGSRSTTAMSMLRVIPGCATLHGRDICGRTVWPDLWPSCRLDCYNRFLVSCYSLQSILR